MSVARVLGRLTHLVKIGKVSEETAFKLLESSGVVLTCKGQVGTYSKGMLKVGAGIVSLDPEAITDFSFPTPKTTPAPAPAPAPQPKAPPASKPSDFDSFKTPDVADLDS